MPSISKYIDTVEMKNGNIHKLINSDHLYRYIGTHFELVYTPPALTYEESFSEECKWMWEGIIN